MKKLSVVLLVFILALSVSACGKSGASGNNSGKKSVTATPTPSKAPINTDATPESIEAAIAAVLGDGYMANIEVPEDELVLSPLGDIDLDKISSYVAKQNPVPSVHADTVIVVRCKDASYADDVVNGFNEFYSRSRKYSTIYPLEPFKLSEARLYKAGDLVIYIVAGAPLPEGLDDAAQLDFAIAEYEKIDGAVKNVLGFLPENLLVTDGGDGNEREENSGMMYSGADIPEE
ncbi:MAG: DUF4358 domain-containing protein [Lachnospiraceae bacterium]|nr:DUF4358 domain-containing protein [Lachnospiraceae bacterium]